MSVVISRAYESNEDKTRLRFDITFSRDVSPKGGKDPTFNLRYKAPPSSAPKNKPKEKTPALTEDKDIVVFCDWPRAWGEQPDAKRPDEVLMQYWRVWATQAAFTGQVQLEIKWTAGADGSDQTIVQGFSAGNDLNATDTVTLATACPRIIRLINSPAVQAPSPPAPSGDAATAMRARVEAALKGICARLDGGLGPVWKLDAALPLVNGRAVCDVPVSELKLPGLLEEAWAQAISEYLVGAPYLGPGGDYLGGQPDSVVFAAAIQSDPAVSIMYACQQLATMSAITRGFDDAASTPYDAQDSKMVQGSWKPAGVCHKPASSAGGGNAAAGLAAGAIRPGSVYVASDVRHIAFVVRALTAGRIQLIDTGAMTPIPGDTAVDPKLPSLRGNFDTHALTGVSRPLQEIGTLAAAPKLGAAVERTRKSRPLGLARLLILSRKPLNADFTPSSSPPAADQAVAHQLLFVSPWLPMWNRSGTQNYPISRLMWSLRQHPFAAELEARWQIDVPQHELFTAMAGARQYTAGTKLPHMPVLDIGSTSDGYVRTVGVLTYTPTSCKTEDCPNFNKTEICHTWTDVASGSKGTVDRPGAKHVADNTGLKYRRPGLGGNVTPTLALGLDAADVPAYLKDDGLK